jgi:outer membrane murein-binding lipoprotein Lpp
MSLGLRERRNRRRREVRWRLFRWTVALAAVLAAGFYAYETGTGLAEREVTRLSEEIASLNARIDDLTQESTRLAEAATAAGNKAEDLELRYQRDVPTGEVKKLYDLAQRKIQEGIDPNRLTFVLSQADQQRACEETVETKRFYVKTPLYEGANDAVGFGGNTITVTAEGAASTDKAGNVLARFDPAQPVVVRFVRLGGDGSEAKGVLPLHHALVSGDEEYRFSLVAGSPGMVKVTAGRCPYP